MPLPTAPQTLAALYARQKGNVLACDRCAERDWDAACRVCGGYFCRECSSQANAGTVICNGCLLAYKLSDEEVW